MKNHYSHVLRVQSSISEELKKQGSRPEPSMTEGPSELSIQKILGFSKSLRVLKTPSGATIEEHLN